MNEEEQETIRVSSGADDSDLEDPRAREEFRKMFGNGSSSESDNDTDFDDIN